MTLAVNILGAYLLSGNSPVNGVTFWLFELAARCLLGNDEAKLAETWFRYFAKS